MFKATPERITALSTAIIAVTSVLAFGLAYEQLRQNHEDSQVSRLLDLDRQYASEPMISYRKAYAEKRLRGVTDPDEEYELLNFFETIGDLTKSGYLNGDDVYNDFSDDVFYLYADTRNTIEQTQKDDPPSYVNFVALVQTLDAIETKNHGTEAHPSQTDLRTYWQSEEVIVPGTPAGAHPRPTTAQ